MDRFKLNCNPKADEKSCVTLDKVRFSVLGAKVIRCEYSANGVFEDRATQHILNRNVELAGSKDFTVNNIKDENGNDCCVIETEDLILKYITKIAGADRAAIEVADEEDSGFANRLSIVCKKLDNHEWNYGDEDVDNLFGTYRTLDNCSGSYCMVDKADIELSKGLASRAGWSVIDDSNTLLFGEDGMLNRRIRSISNDIDVYFFAYGHGYKQCLADYYKMAGEIPLLPRWALGLWWSRWEKYSQSDVLENVEKFKAAEIPLSAYVIDMDWHIVDNPYTNGWTGYTWNRELFPDPRGMFESLHKENLHVCMNLHPDGGVHPHEEKYEKMAEFMGVDPATKKPVEFDIANKKFIEAYFDILHHPLEEDGVDFWWIDWQQGTKSKMDGLDPLWYLNHLHSLDLKRDGKKRQMTFSRWADNGCHRYPIGFSGDTYATWNTLKFLPYFNSTAANVGYGWWSNDVGGFARGCHSDHELYTRWVQQAAFSPIMRLHNCGDPTLDYMPWVKPAPYAEATINSLKVRNSLVSYMYTAAYKNAGGDAPLCRPMYMDYPEVEEAYHCPKQYKFGDNMIFAPFLDPADKETGLSRTVVWLPEGGWYNFFTGKFYEKSGFYPVYGTIDDIPLFVKAGSVIPVDTVPCADSLDETVLLAFPGNGISELYSDDGVSMNYTDGEYRLYKFEQTCDGNKNSVKIASEGGLACDEECDFMLFTVSEGFDYMEFLNSFKGEETAANDFFAGNLMKDNAVASEVAIEKFTFGMTYDEFYNFCLNFNVLGHTMRPVLESFNEWSVDLNKLKKFMSDFTDSQIRCLVEVFAGCGFEVNRVYGGRDSMVYFNHLGDDKFSVEMGQRYEYWYEERQWKGQGCKCEFFPNKSDFYNWLGWVNYGEVMHLKLSGK